MTNKRFSNPKERISDFQEKQIQFELKGDFTTVSIVTEQVQAEGYKGGSEPFYWLGTLKALSETVTRFTAKPEVKGGSETLQEQTLAIKQRYERRGIEVLSVKEVPLTARGIRSNISRGGLIRLLKHFLPGQYFEVTEVTTRLVRYGKPAKESHYSVKLSAEQTEYLKSRLPLFNATLARLGEKVNPAIFTVFNQGDCKKLRIPYLGDAVSNRSVRVRPGRPKLRQR